MDDVATHAACGDCLCTEREVITVARKTMAVRQPLRVPTEGNFRNRRRARVGDWMPLSPGDIAQR